MPEDSGVVDDIDSHDDQDQAVSQAAGILAAWLTIARPITTSHQQIETALNERHALCLTAYEVMACLNDRHGWTPMSAVCKTVDRSQPRLSRLVKQMEDRGLVDRAQLAGDKRAFQLNLTRKGRRTYRSAATTVLESLQSIETRDDYSGQALRRRHSLTADED